MFEIGWKTLVLVIMATEAEIQRLRALPEERIVAEDELLLIDYENAAEELKELYQVACTKYSNLPPYSRLVKGTD